MKKRFLSILIAFAMIVSMIPLNASAQVTPMPFIIDGGHDITYILGDVDGNAVININDATEILKYIIGMGNVIDNNERAFAASLITNPNRPTMLDAMEIMNFITGRPSTLPSGGHFARPAVLLSYIRAEVDMKEGIIRYITTKPIFANSEVLPIELKLSGLRVVENPVLPSRSDGDTPLPPGTMLSTAYDSNTGSLRAILAVSHTIEADSVIMVQYFQPHPVEAGPQIAADGALTSFEGAVYFNIGGPIVSTTPATTATAPTSTTPPPDVTVTATTTDIVYHQCTICNRWTSNQIGKPCIGCMQQVTTVSGTVTTSSLTTTLLAGYSCPICSFLVVITPDGVRCAYHNCQYIATTIPGTTTTPPIVTSGTITSPPITTTTTPLTTTRLALCVECNNPSSSICPNCDFCAECDWSKWRNRHCRGCHWGQDCIEGEFGKEWCTSCHNCKECCECGDTDGSFNANDLTGLLTFRLQESNSSKLGWNTRSPGTWRGVTWCDNEENRRVTAIDFIGMDLTGRLNLKGFTQLETLLISNNQLVGLDVTDCVSLKTLRANWNRIREISTFDGLFDLHWVDIRYNNLDLNDENTAALIRRYSALVEANRGELYSEPQHNGRITKEMLEEIRKGKELVRITLECNRIITIDPDRITDAIRSISLNIGIERATLSDRNSGIHENSIVIRPYEHGEFGFEMSFDITAEQLQAASLNASQIRLFYVDDNGNVTTGGRVTRNADGSVTIGISRASYYVLSEIPPEIQQIFNGGDINGDGVICILDVLEILKALSGIPSVVTAEQVSINDALEILKFLAGIEDNKVTVPKSKD
jgi:hypothetical protein